MSIDFSKFDKQVDIQGLKKDITEASENGGDYKEVPHGTYEVEVSKMELGESKKGDPMVIIWFKILNGEYKGSLLFYNQVIPLGFQIHNANQLLRDMDTGLDIEFETYAQYGQLLLDVHEKIDKQLEFAIKYGVNNKGYDTFKVVEVFEVDE